MDSSDLLGPGQVGNGACDAKHPMKAASGQPHCRRRIGEQLASRIVGGCNFLQNLAIRLRIRSNARAVVAIGLQLTGGRNPASNLGAALGRWRKREIGGRNALHFDVKVDAVEQRTRNPCLIVRGAPGSAAASKRRVSQMAAPAGVHRCHKLHPRREGDVSIGSCNADIAGLEGLPKRIQNTALEFWQFIEKQDTEVGKADFARPDSKSAAH